MEPGRGAFQKGKEPVRTSAASRNLAGRRPAVSSPMWEDGAEELKRGPKPALPAAPRCLGFTLQVTEILMGFAGGRMLGFPTLIYEFIYCREANLERSRQEAI